MGRKPRNFYEGGIYHIIQRGNNRSFIFDDQLDKAMFLSIIKDVMVSLPFDLLYYVIMDNHYHLMIEMKNVPIGQIMHKINMTYSRYYNKKYSRSGTIFGSRFTSVLVKDLRQFMQLIVYLAFNPVKAEIVKHPADYRWCAHLEIVSTRNYIVNRRQMLRVLHKKEHEAVMIYQDLLAEKIIKSDSLDDRGGFNHKAEMKTLLLEIAGDMENYRKVLQGDKSSLTIAAKRKFVLAGADQGFDTDDLASFLKITQRMVRKYKNS